MPLAVQRGPSRTSKTAAAGIELTMSPMTGAVRRLLEIPGVTCPCPRADKRGAGHRGAGPGETAPGPQAGNGPAEVMLFGASRSCKLGRPSDPAMPRLVGGASRLLRVLRTLSVNAPPSGPLR